MAPAIRAPLGRIDVSAFLEALASIIIFRANSRPAPRLTAPD
jgi:hypothetical protein